MGPSAARVASRNHINMANYRKYFQLIKNWGTFQLNQLQTLGIYGTCFADRLQCNLCLNVLRDFIFICSCKMHIFSWSKIGCLWSSMIYRFLSFLFPSAAFLSIFLFSPFFLPPLVILPVFYHCWIVQIPVQHWCTAKLSGL